MQDEQQNIELSIVILCRNEERTIASCVQSAGAWAGGRKIKTEILVIDNASDDRSAPRAKEAGADVLRVETVGYGAALREGVAAAKGKFVIIADGDGQHDVGSLDGFIDKLREGYDLAVGNRYFGKTTDGCRGLPRRLGNFLISRIGKLFFKVSIGDFNCGLRGMRAERIRALGLECRGMEAASEVIAKAALAGLRITEVPTTVFPRHQLSQSHLKVWRDGWRHFRILLCFSPNYMFLYPGIFFTALGVLGVSALFFGSVVIGDVKFNLHTMLISAAAVICGLQLLIFFALVRTFQESIHIMSESWLTQGLRQRTFGDMSLILALILLAIGTAGMVEFLLIWAEAGYDNLDPSRHMRILIFALTFFISGLQLLSSSFVYYLLNIKRI